MNKYKSLEQFGFRNFNNFTLNDRYSKRTFTLSKDTINHNNYNKTINKEHSGRNDVKSISISDVIKKMEKLKKKYNKLNYIKKINSRIAYNRILDLKKKYFDENNKMETNDNKDKNKNMFKIEVTDKISMINKNRTKNKNYNLILQRTNNSEKKFYTLANDKNFNFQKSNEINYQISSESIKTNENTINLKKSKSNKFKFKINLFNINSDENNKNKRDEFLNLDKKINLLLKDTDNNDEGTLYNIKRNKSVCPIKDRIILLTDVKNKIKKINEDKYEENDKTKNSDCSTDSHITLGFKHIKPVIKKEIFFEDYLKDDEPKKDNESISKPILIRSLPRPKLNVPNYPSFFRK